MNTIQAERRENQISGTAGRLGYFRTLLNQRLWAREKGKGNFETCYTGLWITLAFRNTSES